jgi:hypothetical protein
LVKTVPLLLSCRREGNKGDMGAGRSWESGQGMPCVVLSACEALPTALLGAYDMECVGGAVVYLGTSDVMVKRPACRSSGASHV